LFALLALVIGSVNLVRWRPVAFVVTLPGIALLLFAGFFMQNPFTTVIAPQDSTPNSDTDLFRVVTLSAARRGALVALAGAFYALIVAGRVRHWGWFTTLAIASVISAIAGVLLVPPTILFGFLGQQHAHDSGSGPGYVVIFSVVTRLPLLLLLLIALLSGRTSATYPSPAVASSDAVMLP
jgi:hypothetical protein